MKSIYYLFFMVCGLAFGLRADLNNDHKVDFNDFLIMAEEWLMEDNMYPDQLVVSGELSHNIPGTYSLQPDLYNGYPIWQHETEATNVLYYDSAARYWLLSMTGTAFAHGWRKYDAVGEDPLGQYDPVGYAVGIATVTEVEAPAATDASLLTEIEKRAIARLITLTKADGTPVFNNIEIVDGVAQRKKKTDGTDTEASVDHWTGQISFGKSGMESFERFAPFAFVCCRLARVTREGGYDANIRITLDIVIGQHDDKGYARIGRDGLVGLNRIFELVFMAFDGWHPGTWRPGEPIGCDDFFLVDTMESVEDKTKYGRQLHFEANWIPVTE